MALEDVTKIANSGTVLPLLLASVVFFSFLIFKFYKRYIPFVGRCALFLVFSLVLLLPVGLPIRHPSTMMTSVLCFLIFFQTAHLAFWPPPQTADSSFLSDLLSWVGGYAWLLLPISYVPQEKRPSWRTLFERFVETAFVLTLKLLFLPIFNDVILRTYTPELLAKAQGNQLLRIQLAVFYMPILVAGMWAMDFLYAVIPLLSARRLECIAFNNYVILSDSIGSFWGRRYNRLISTWLHAAVFSPARRAQLPASLAVMASFCVSGLLHAYVAHFVFATGEFVSFLFFLVHGVGCVVEGIALRSFPKLKSLPWILRNQVTLAFVVATFPLYPALFVDAMPDWLLNSPSDIPLPIQNFSRGTLMPVLARFHPIFAS